MKISILLLAFLNGVFIIQPFSGRENTNLVSGNVKSLKVHILLLMDDDYGANFNVDDESLNIAELFESFGWELSIAALNDTVQPCEEAVKYFNRGTVKTDIRISEIKDLSIYQALVILPGRSHKNLINSKAALILIQTAVQNELVVAAWYRGVRVLAVADVVRGKRITGHADYKEEYLKAGAEYVPDNPPPVVDGNIITTVRSRYYRQQMCEAIRKAVEEK